MATILTNYLRPPKAPNLAVGPVQYDQRYQDQLNNQLRIYFNELDNALQTILGTDGGGGKFIRFPYGAFHEDGATTLSVGITNVSTTAISVGSTTGFPSSGYILIGSEVIQYTSKTSTTFGGTITRGVLGTTNVAHSVGAAITEVQGTGSSTTIGSVLFNNTDYSNGVSIDSTDNSKVVFDNPGLYNIQISAQLLNFTTSEDNVTFWFRLNGTDIDNTASIAEVHPKHGTAPGATILSYNIFQQVEADDYIQVEWTSNTGNTIVATYPAGTSPTHPVSPAIILTAQFVSAVST
jgi:hypothetical protein